MKVYKDGSLQIIFGVTLMGVLGISSITPAFPKIVDELQISTVQVGMLITAFSLPAAFLAPVLGVLADRFGRKRILIPSLMIFGITGAACALTKDFGVIIALRAIQGITSAGLFLLSFTIIGDLFSGQRRTEAVGLNTTVVQIGNTAYPLIGGMLATLAWNYPFLLSLAAIPVGVLALRFLDNPEPKSDQNLRQYLGSVWGYLINIRVAGAFAGQIVRGLLLNGSILTYFSLYMGVSLQASPFTIGFITSGMFLVTGLVASQIGRINRVMSEPDLIKLGFALYAIGLVLVPFITRLELLLIPAIILGVASGLCYPSLMSYVSGLAPPECRAAFMSVNSLMIRVGGALGPMVVGLFYVYASFEGAFFYSVALGLVAAIVGFIGGKMVR